MTYKIYLNLKDYPKFRDLPNSLSYERDKNTPLFSRVIDTINRVKDDDTTVILYGVEPFEYNLSDLESMFDEFDKHNIKYTFTTRLTTPVTSAKIDLGKRCTFGEYKHTIFLTFDYGDLCHQNAIGFWDERLNSFRQNRVKCIPLIILTKDLINHAKPRALINFFKTRGINLIEFWFVSPSDLEKLPDNNSLINWLTECYKVYKETNKGKQTYEKFQIRSFNRLKMAKNGLLKGLTTTNITISPLGGLITIPCKECRLCENCRFKDYYRNKENIPIFKDKECCLMKIFK